MGGQPNGSSRHRFISSPLDGRDARTFLAFSERKRTGGERKYLLVGQTEVAIGNVIAVSPLAMPVASYRRSTISPAPAWSIAITVLQRVP